jgi:gluconokinase
MSAGIALDDADRWPWLDEIAANMANTSRASGADDIIFTGCSSLRRRYRDHLLAGIGAPAHFIYLAADRALITQRMAARDGHFMPNSLIDSQFLTLEIPADNEPASHIDISGSMDVVMTRILAVITPLITGN